MHVAILALIIEIAIQTAFLFVALWIMIKLQKLDYRFLPLLGTAALVSGLDEIMDATLGHYLGFYLATTISTPIVIAVLCYCLTKLTRAEYVDVLFTVFVGYALLFGMNLWLLGALMGDLRVSAREADAEPVPEQVEALQHAVAATNLPPAASPRGTTAPAARRRPAPGSHPAEPPVFKAGEEVAKSFKFTGLTRNGTNSAIVFNTGVKAYTLVLGESRLVNTARGMVPVRFVELGKDWVAFEVAGEPVTLSLR
jgi:hypothetical protein